MWRLKVGEGSGPWLRSTNGFLGRTVWEFDASAGAAEERGEVERVRREFADGRLRRRESADLLMRLQYGKQNNHDEDHHRLPPVKKLKKEDEVTEEIALASLRRALNQFSSLQSNNGCWPGDFSGVMFIMPGLVFSLYVTRSLDASLTPEHHERFAGTSTIIRTRMGDGAP
uniref:Uncharacterized protein n=1 Tax=Avena sativa TaxID=4498 RepID=A0ACD5UW96_AVESA